MTTTITADFIETADNVLYLAWKHAGGEHVCDHHAPIVWDMAMVRAKSALRVLTACTTEQADDAIAQALESDHDHGEEV
jgi:hypothetical protein